MTYGDGFFIVRRVSTFTVQATLFVKLQPAVLLTRVADDNIFEKIRIRHFLQNYNFTTNIKFCLLSNDSGFHQIRAVRLRRTSKLLKSVTTC